MKAARRSRRAVRDLAVAASLLTAVPIPVSVGGRTSAAAWFPLVGLALGTLSAAAGAVLVGPIGAPAHVAGALLIALGAVATRMLHLDGLADVADAWWGGGTPEARRRIMKDSHVGSFGAAALLIVMLLEFSALVIVLEQRAWWVLLVAVMVSRMAATFAASLGTAAEGSTLGASVMRPSVPLFLIVGGVCLAFCGALAVSAAGLAGSVLLVVGVLAAAACPHVISGRMGGVTGDVMGAAVVITECVVLVLAATVL